MAQEVMPMTRKMMSFCQLEVTIRQEVKAVAVPVLALVADRIVLRRVILTRDLTIQLTNMQKTD